MGFKLIKESFKIKCTYVHVWDGEIIIGTHFLPFIRITQQGKVFPKSNFQLSSDPDELKRVYLELLKCSTSGELRKLVQAPDSFNTPLIPVYYIQQGNLMTKYCENTGWPNTTTEGELMDSKKFFIVRKDAITEFRRQTLVAFYYAASTYQKRLKELKRSTLILLRTLFQYLKARAIF